MDAIRAIMWTTGRRRTADGTGFCCALPISPALWSWPATAGTPRAVVLHRQETAPNGDGTAKALWRPGKVAIDFVKEGEAGRTGTD
jgi:hypothetical protein